MDDDTHADRCGGPWTIDVSSIACSACLIRLTVRPADQRCPVCVRPLTLETIRWRETCGHGWERWHGPPVNGDARSSHPPRRRGGNTHRKKFLARPYAREL